MKARKTDTAEGRAALDDDVVALLDGSATPLLGDEIRAAVGGSNLQIRTSLSRLVEAGRVSFKSHPRATLYYTAKTASSDREVTPTTRG